MEYLLKTGIKVEAVQFLGFNEQNGQVEFSEKPEWLTKQFGNRIKFFDKPNTLTLIGIKDYLVHQGDYICRFQEEGEFMNILYIAMCPSIFNLLFEKV